MPSEGQGGMPPRSYFYTCYDVESRIETECAIMKNNLTSHDSCDTCLNYTHWRSPAISPHCVLRRANEIIMVAEWCAEPKVAR